MPSLSVIVITRNEAAHIDAALASVAWADEILVVDAESTDDTVAIARQRAHRVDVRPWPGYGAQKNYAASIAAHDWILSIDADERVTAALATEIRTLLTAEPPARGYRLKRVTWYLGRWIRATDWYPDRQLRLYDRRVARWNTRPVHESVEVDGAVSSLESELEHYAYRDVRHHLDTINRYTTLAAEHMAASGRRARLIDLLVQGPAAFLRNYLLRGGVREGRVGLIVSTLNAYYVFVKYVKLWERRHTSRS